MQSAHLLNPSLIRRWMTRVHMLVQKARSGSQSRPCCVSGIKDARGSVVCALAVSRRCREVTRRRWGSIRVDTKCIRFQPHTLFPCVEQETDSLTRRCRSRAATVRSQQVGRGGSHAVKRTTKRPRAQIVVPKVCQAFSSVHPQRRRQMHSTLLLASLAASVASATFALSYVECPTDASVRLTGSPQGGERRLRSGCC